MADTRIISCGHDHHAHSNQLQRSVILRSPTGSGWTHNPSPCAKKINLLVIEGPNRGRPGARFPRQYEQLFKDSLNMYLTDMPSAMTDTDISTEEMPYVDNLFYMDNLSNIHPSFTDGDILHAAIPDSSLTMNPLKQLIFEKLEALKKQGDTIHGIMFYDEYITGPVGLALTSCNNNRIPLFIVKVSSGNIERRPEYEVANLSLIAAHELGHTLEGNHEKTKDGTGIAGQQRPCSLNNFAIFNNDLNAGTIMNGVFGLVDVANSKKEFNSYWSPTNAQHLLGVIKRRGWYPRSTETINMWLDADGDGEGNPDSLQVVCAGDTLDGYVFNDTDPDDSNAGITPVTETDIDPLRIYPNPTTGRLHISGLAIRHISVLTLDGKRIVHTTQRAIDLSPYPAGVYLVQIQSDKTTYTKKIMKMH